MKKIVSIALAIALCTSSMTGMVNAQEDENIAVRTETTQTVEETETETETATTQEKEQEAYLSAYFEDSVLVGDSVALGFSNYITRNKIPIFSNMQFLTCGGFGANNALKPVTEENPHPVYQGQKRSVWDSIAMMEVSNVFISFGLNDLNPCRNRTTEKYLEVINKILELSPDAKITIVSITNVLKGAESGRINNDYIRETNELLKEMAKEHEWGYLDLASLLEDEAGNLKQEYCSDGFVHLSKVTYQKVWCPMLQEYALENKE